MLYRQDESQHVTGMGACDFPTPFCREDDPGQHCPSIIKKGIRPAARTDKRSLGIQASQNHNNVRFRFISPIVSLLPQKQFIDIAQIVAVI